MCKRQTSGVLNSSLESVLSCRLREGYYIRSVSVEDNAIQVRLPGPESKRVRGTAGHSNYLPQNSRQKSVLKTVSAGVVATEKCLSSYGGLYVLGRLEALRMSHNMGCVSNKLPRKWLLYNTSVQRGDHHRAGNDALPSRPRAVIYPFAASLNRSTWCYRGSTQFSSSTT